MRGLTRRARRRTAAAGAAFLAGLATLAASPCPAGAAEFRIAEGGKALCTIALPAQAAPGERLAAEELARTVEAMSGARLEIREDAGTSGPALRFARLPGTEEAWSIYPDGGDLVLGASRPRCALNAAYDCLELLGCRWLAPEFGFYEGTAQVVPKRDSLSLNLDAPVSVKPALKFRKLYVEEGLSHDAENLLQMVEWMPKAGYNTLVIPSDYQGSGRVLWDKWREALTPELQKRDLTVEVGGHGYQNFLHAKMEDGKLFERSPEWFGQDARGQRRRSKSRVFCTSNRGAVDFLTSNAAAYVKARPEIEIFDFWPPDGAEWCECAPCVALGSATDRQALLIAQVKPALLAARPGLRLEALAYATSITPPETVKLDKDVLLDFCPIAQNFWTGIDDTESTTNAKYVSGLKAWRKKFDGDISVYSYYRKYAWDSLPVVIPRYMQADLRFYRTIPVQGVSIYGEPGDWVTYELNHYALARLGENPDLDVEALIADYCQARYGQAGPNAAAALRILGDAVRRHGGIPGTRSGSTEDLQRAGARIKGTVSALKSVRKSMEEDETASRSLSRLLDMCDYAGRDLELRRMQAEGAPAEAIRAGALSMHEFLQSRRGQGLFIERRISPAKLFKKYGAEEK